MAIVVLLGIPALIFAMVLHREWRAIYAIAAVILLGMWLGPHFVTGELYYESTIGPGYNRDWVR